MRATINQPQKQLEMIQEKYTELDKTNNQKEPEKKIEYHTDEKELAKKTE